MLLVYHLQPQDQSLLTLVSSQAFNSRQKKKPSKEAIEDGSNRPGLMDLSQQQPSMVFLRKAVIPLQVKIFLLIVIGIRPSQLSFLKQMPAKWGSKPKSRDLSSYKAFLGVGVVHSAAVAEGFLRLVLPAMPMRSANWTGCEMKVAPFRCLVWYAIPGQGTIGNVSY